ncbi:MAG: dTDP-4-dehydrorhamnose reductase [Gammaproteobacteria bacterium]|nr:dTDP-4-dehydrorhamnose reductase [Gammaproteobacteria bacterium]
MKVLITGGSGQLGGELQRTQPPGSTVFAPGRGQLDISDRPAVTAHVRRTRPDVVINAAAYTSVDRAEQNAEDALRVNAGGAENVALAAMEAGARLIHVSTDYVFDGRSASPYATDHPLQPVNKYGESKAEGERRVMTATRDQAVIVRTAWLYAATGANFVNTMLRLFRGQESVNVVSDQIGSPTWARGLARSLWRFAATPGLGGRFHWTDDGECSWHEFSLAIHDEAFALGMLPRRCRILPITTCDWPTPAPRPAYSVLDKRTTWRALGMKAPHWRAALREMLQDVNDNAPK